MQNCSRKAEVDLFENLEYITCCKEMNDFGWPSKARMPERCNLSEPYVSLRNCLDLALLNKQGARAGRLCQSARISHLMGSDLRGRPKLA